MKKLISILAIAFAFLAFTLPSTASAELFNQIANKYSSTANDSDKSWTVPNNKRWRINWIHIEYTSTASAGNRQLKVEVRDAANNLRMDSHAGTVQAASLVRQYEFMLGIFRETSFIDGALQVPLPFNLVIPAGWSLRVYDETAVDAAADDMVVSFQYQYD